MAALIGIVSWRSLTIEAHLRNQSNKSKLALCKPWIHLNRWWKNSSMLHSCCFSLSVSTTSVIHHFFFGYATRAYSKVVPCVWFLRRWLKLWITRQLFTLSALDLGRVASDNYATKECKLIFDNCFCLKVMIFLKSLKCSMANRKHCTLETKTLIKEN